MSTFSFNAVANDTATGSETDDIRIALEEFGGNWRSTQGQDHQTRVSQTGILIRNPAEGTAVFVNAQTIDDWIQTLGGSTRAGSGVDHGRKVVNNLYRWRDDIEPPTDAQIENLFGKGIPRLE